MRVLKTLSCLVFAMTGTSAALHWLDPSAALVQDADREQRLVSRAVHAVNEGVDVVGDRWSAVRVAGASEFPTGSMLAATADAKSWHFLVRKDGRVHVGAMWRRQSQVSDLPHTICVQIGGVADVGDSSAAQQLALRALLVGINRIVTPNGPPLAVRMNTGIVAG